LTSGLYFVRVAAPPPHLLNGTNRMTIARELAARGQLPMPRGTSCIQ